MKILIVEDDADTAAYITRGLSEHGHASDIAADGHEGLMLAQGGAYDVWIIDRMLPKLDGVSLLKVLREGGNSTPALFLTAMGSINDKLKGFDAGGDDYLLKPFAFAELYARMTSLARRPPVSRQQDTILQVGDITLDLVRRSAVRGDQEISLQPTEFRLLEYLMRHAGRVVTRTMLLEAVWDFHFDPKTSVVETHISRLRAKLDRGFDNEAIKTVRGAGYRFDA
jgi:two-component system OmpR family response regulator